MTNQEIFDLMDRFQRSSIHTMKLSTQEFTIELSRGSVSAPASAASVAAAAPAVPDAPAPSPAPAAEGSAVTTPLVGTIYAAPAPEKPPFVQAGDRVKKGDTLCLIEAMKMLGAAGAVEAIFTALSLRDGYLPATINYRTPDPECDLDVIPNQGRKADVRYAMSNSLGFGGHNGSLLLKKWED